VKDANRHAVQPVKKIPGGDLWRVPLLVAAILALLAAIWAGWLRIGWQWPAWQPGLIAEHGPLMISGFFGTLISLERAVALRRRWPYTGPVLSGLGGLALLAGVRGSLPSCWSAGAWPGRIFAAILRQHLARYTLVMAAAQAWLGNLLAGRAPVYELVLWWAGFWS
jgi:hypothetical protein